VKAEYYGQFYYYDERFGGSLILGKKCLGEHQGSVRAVFIRKMTDWTAQSVIVNR
jgi:hypothetical protein